MWWNPPARLLYKVGLFSILFILSPSLILSPSPGILEDGICHLLYQEYMRKDLENPYANAIFMASIPPDISRASNPPSSWGHFSTAVQGDILALLTHRMENAL